MGGKLRTESFAGRPLDVGADMWLATVPEAVSLARAVGIGSSLVAPATTEAHVLVGGRLRRLPSGTLLGVPGRAWPVVRSGVLSLRGLARAGVEPLLPGRPLSGPSTVGAVVGRRFGREVVDRLVDPLIGGVYAGRADELDLDAAAPQLASVARRHRSLLLGARSLRAGRDSGPPFLSVREGQSSFASAVASASGAEVLTGTRALALERVGSGWRVTLAGGRALVCDAVVVAVPAKPAAKLLGPVAPDAAAALETIRYASVAIVALEWPGALPRGSGYLVPASERQLVKAVTFSSQKWAHLSSGTPIVRCSVGRAGEPPPADDDELLRAVSRELPGTGSAAATLVKRWPEALPQYAVGHTVLVARIQAAVAAVPGLAVAGAAYEGVGVPACIRSGQRAAARIMAP